MNTFKNTNYRQKWGKEGDKEYDRAVRLEMDKVAPPWTEESPLNLGEKEREKKTVKKTTETT